MFNLFKMESFRARKSKITIITLVIINLFVFLNVFAEHTMASMLEGSVGSWNFSENYMQLLSSVGYTLFWAIAISVYIAGEYKHGFVKSIAGQIPSKMALVFSKMFYSFLYTVLAFVSSGMVLLITGLLFYGSRVVWTFDISMIGIWFIQLLLHVAYSSMFLFITFLLRNSVLGVGLGVFISCGMSGMIYTLINYLVDKAGIVSDFDIGVYALDTNIDMVAAAASSAILIRGVVIAVIYGVVFGLLSCLVLEKKDF